jgi:opacity protein-like surface antigen
MVWPELLLLLPGPISMSLPETAMLRISKPLGVLFAVAACALSTAALGDNLLGFYIGAGVGQSQIRSDDPAYGYPAYYNDYQTAYQGFIGIRPIKVLGVEAEYLAFGQPSNCNSYYNGNNYCDPNRFGNDSNPTAAALFAVGYLPVPIPYIDIFGKAGGARLSLNVNTFVQQPCIPGGPCPNLVPVSRQGVTDTKFAYGGGVQSKFPFGLTLRAEYERVSSQYGDPDALMVSAIWTF